MENTAKEEVDMYSRIEAKTEEWLHSISKQFQYCSNGKKAQEFHRINLSSPRPATRQDKPHSSMIKSIVDV